MTMQKWFSRNGIQLLLLLVTITLSIVGYLLVDKLDDLDERPTKAEVKNIVVEVTGEHFKSLDATTATNAQAISANTAAIKVISEMNTTVKAISDNQIEQGKDLAVIKYQLETNNGQ